MQESLFALPADRQRSMMLAYPSLAGDELQTGDAGGYSILDQGQAGLTFLSEEERNAYSEMNAAYLDRYGFPLIISLKGLQPEQILALGWQRLDNSQAQEEAAAIVEISKIANKRLGERVADTDPQGASRAAQLVRLH